MLFLIFEQMSVFCVHLLRTILKQQQQQQQQQQQFASSLKGALRLCG
ncbi:MAG: hypothetical protein ACJASQ_003808 [Crocinitomicaceae bacterium]